MGDPLARHADRTFFSAVTHSHYDNLQVSRQASEAVIRAAYKVLASRYHPDKASVPVAEANRIMKLINEAHDVLTDADRRREHDEWLEREEASSRSPRAPPEPARSHSSYEPSPPAAQPPPAPPSAVGQAEKRDDWSNVRSAVKGPIAWLLGAAGLFALINAISGRPAAPGPALAVTSSMSDGTITTVAAKVVAQPAEASSSAVDYAAAADYIARIVVNAGVGALQQSKSRTLGSSYPSRYVRSETAPNGKLWPTGADYVSGYPLLNENGHGKVTVDNSGNDSDVFVKLAEMGGAGSSVHMVRHIFIPARGVFTADTVAPGLYDVRYMDLTSGSLFKTDSFRLTEVRTESGLNYSAVRLTLYKVRDGNMQTYPIDSAAFD